MSVDAGPFADVIGQTRAVERLQAALADPVHAYLFVGPRGAGKRRAAARFAGEIVGDEADRERARRLVKSEEHPDLVVFEPEGNLLRAEEVEPIVIEASRAPVEASRKVIVIDRFHEATPEAAARLLKPIEEPPPSTIFVLLTEEIPPEHITIASRSTQIDFPAVSVGVLREALIDRGVAAEIADAAAVGSGGDITRAELLITDEAFGTRRALWWNAPSRLDGSGHAVSEIVREIREAVEASQAPLDERQAAESERLDEVEAVTGTRGSGRSAMQARHRREARAHRTDEWRMGLATLAQRYRAAMDPESAGTVDPDIFRTLTDAAEALGRNVNDELWLTALLLKAPYLPEAA